MKKSRYRSPYQSYAIVGVIVVGAVMVALLMSGSMLSLATWWICSSIATWLMYTFDKMQAKRKDAGRVPELVLLGMVLIGGWGGGFIALFFPRHKTRHLHFIIVPIVAAVFHIAVAIRMGWV
jgi:uncharacterized membrane protein YsdA (DUF1294 family)